MSDIKPFTVSFPESRISDLQRRLDQSIYPDELQDASWDMGTPLTDVERIAQHWRQNFDWKAAEQRLNALPQFTTSIQVNGFEPLSIHFVHIKSEAPGAIPLLFCHGWPGSYIEVFKIAKGLSDSRDGGPSFHIVAPSLPNFGFSQGPKKRGFAYEQYAQTCHELMLKLGYGKYATQGGKPSAPIHILPFLSQRENPTNTINYTGDWGWAITRTMSLLYPDSCLATHFNMDVGDPPSSLKSTQPNNPHPLPSNPTPREVAGVERTKWFTQEGYGYNMQQGTKPQTIAYALADSPLALLAWIYEKLHDWTDSYPWTDDEICTWISIYWFSTAGPGAAGRIYYEVQHDKNGKRASLESRVGG